MKENRTTVAAYYFPNWHPTPQNDAVHGRGWTEWEVAKCARPRFPGHRQPRIPLWGYEDESDPAVMAGKIEAARRHGIDCFLFDWYYSDEGPFREEALNRGFLGGGNPGDMKFAVMWCNHSRQGLHPAPYTMTVETFARAGISPKNYEAMTDHIVRDYFSHPNYWKIGGRPFFAIYSIRQMIDDGGSVEACAAMLDRLREKAAAAGFPGIHLHVIGCFLDTMTAQMNGQLPVAPGDPLCAWVGRDPGELIRALGVDSLGDYGWQWKGGFPQTDSEAVRRRTLERWRDLIGANAIPSYPTVMVGWDCSPRTVQSDIYEPRGYPWCDIWSQTPEEFRFMLAEAKKILETRPAEERVCFLNAWNEWTEGAYLEPDTVNGYGFLEAVRDIYGTRPRLRDARRETETNTISSTGGLL